MSHKRPAWVNPASQVKRTTGRKLQAQRAALFLREPLCRVCAVAGRHTLATIRDHIVPLAEGGTDDDDNVQPICKPCHDGKTLAESLRGRGIVVHAPTGPAPARPARPVPAVEPGRVGGGEISGAVPAETVHQVKFLCAGVLGGGGTPGDGHGDATALCATVADQLGGGD